MATVHDACAACKRNRKRCGKNCEFAPYFPPSHEQQFDDVNRLYGASNFLNLLNKVQPNQRDDAAASMIIEAGLRRLDPVRGVTGIVKVLEQRLIDARHKVQLLRDSLQMAKSGNINPDQFNQWQEQLSEALMRPSAPEAGVISQHAENLESQAEESSQPAEILVRKFKHCW